MKPFTSRSLFFLLAAASLSGACQEPSSAVETHSQAIRNGTILTPWPSGSSNERSIVAVPGCTGTMLAADWVLTAKHCGVTVGTTMNPTQVFSKRPTGNVARTVDAVIDPPDPSDIALLHLSTPFTDVPVVNLYDRPTTWTFGRTAAVYGYGAFAQGGSCSATVACPAGQGCVGTTCFTFDGNLRTASLNVQADGPYGPETFKLATSATNQNTLPGDSGGPSFVDGRQVGVHSTPGADMSVLSLRDWISTPSRVSYTTGDFNNDGRMDLIIVTPNGSWWYYATGRGTFSNPYTRTDLKLGKVKYTPGDFNGDGNTDLLITTADGTEFYQSDGTGGWIDIGIWEWSTFKLGRSEFYVGNFDGDQYDDFIVSGTVDGNLVGSYLYYGKGAWGWELGWRWEDLPWGKVSFVPGDFDGDGRDDVIVVSAAGSSFYYSNGRSSWTRSYERPDLKLGEVSYRTGMFDAVVGTDLIITTVNGSWWYYARGRGGWHDGYYRSDLTWGNVTYVTGNFDGDTMDDLIITTTAGSYWYFSTGVGTWDQRDVRTDLPRGTALFTVGDFDNDLREDVIVVTQSGSTWRYGTGRGTWHDALNRPDLPR